MTQCKLYLDTRRIKADGTFPVRIKVGSGSNLYLPTGVCVSESSWDPAECRITSTSRRNDNMILSTMLNNVRMRLASLKSTGEWDRLSNAQRKTLLLDPDKKIEELSQPDQPTLGNFYRKVVATKKGARTREIYMSTLSKLNAYKDVDKVTFAEITKMWLKGFEASMAGLSPNTVNIHLRNLRNVINCAIDDGLTNNYPFRRYKLPKEETKKRALDIDKFRRLLALEGLSPSQQEYRDMYLLIFLLLGINLVDLYSLTTENVVNGRIEYRRAKTGKLYSIRIEPETQEILSRYKGRRHLLAFADRYANHKDYAKRMNEALGKLGEMVPTPIKEIHRGVKKFRMKPIEPDLTAYWARHSWGTYAAEIDIPFDTISEALGHEHTGSDTTLIYIKYRNTKIDDANRKVIDWVLKGRDTNS